MAEDNKDGRGFGFPAEYLDKYLKDYISWIPQSFPPRLPLLPRSQNYDDWGVDNWFTSPVICKDFSVGVDLVGTSTTPAGPNEELSSEKFQEAALRITRDFNLLSFKHLLDEPPQAKTTFEEALTSEDKDFLRGLNIRP